MITRHDAVLAVIPILAIGGFGLSRAVHVLDTAIGVGSRLDPIPFTVIGLVAALVVIVREVLSPSFGGDR